MQSSYQLLDSGDFEKLEQIGPYRIVRPSAVSLWSRRLPPSDWKNFDARFERFSGGDGKWQIVNSELKNGVEIEFGGLRVQVRLTSFGHLGIFPEQLTNWERITRLVREKNKPDFQVLNLFAYTGLASLAAARGGAKVAHLDASKTSVTWARELALLNGLGEAPIRWLVDDVTDFVNKEIKRGSRYQGLILDPPSFGRGPKNQVWKIDEHLPELLRNCRKILADDFAFIALSSHSPHHTPKTLENTLRDVVHDGTFTAEEMLIQEASGRSLPSGVSCFFENRR